MKNKEKKYIESVIENEGFDYAFMHYSDFDEISDEKFHELRKAYLAASAKLHEYVGIKYIGLDY